MHIHIEPTTTACWQKLVHEALNKSNRNLNEDMESYLIFLLIRFTKNIEIANSILALDYLESQAMTGQSKQDSLRDVGDKCLLFSGFYPEQAHKRLVSLDYFVNIGRGAYEQIATTHNSGHNFVSLKKLFADLSNNFIELIDILHHIKLFDKNNQWMLDEITKFEKQKTQEESNIIHIHSRRPGTRH